MKHPQSPSMGNGAGVDNGTYCNPSRKWAKARDIGHHTQIHIQIEGTPHPPTPTLPPPLYLHCLLGTSGVWRGLRAIYTLGG